MTDLELMYLLEENGYEPSIENLMILKEETRSTKEIRKKLMNKEKISKKTPEYQLFKNNSLGKHISTEISKYDKRKNGDQITVKIPNESHEFLNTEHGKTLLKKASENKKRAEIYSESYSDYELYQILEENGYTTTEKNLSILKEGIENGKYIIETDEKFYKSDFLGEPPIDINFDGDERPKNKGLKSLSKKIKPMLRKNPIDCSRENCKTD